MTPAPVKPLIFIDDLEKIDIRVGTILVVEDVPNSEKLVRRYADKLASVLALPEKPVPNGTRAG